MALGYTTYKTPNAINRIKDDLTGKEGCGVYLNGQGSVAVAVTLEATPYGIIVVGGESVDGTYAGPIAGSAIEFVDQIGCVVQVTVSSATAIAAGQFLQIDDVDADGTFTVAAPTAAGQWIWGLALTNADPGEQCLMRFQPTYVWYIAP
tara:strand:+ start:48 stop:494 length:447 start_codon:yes stop_codon:yes gene_type:complete